MANVDVMTDVSMAPTAFTRYTVAPSTAAVSRASKRSSRSKRKMERKVRSGRKGTVDEEEYLLKSVGKLVERFKNTQGPVFKFPGCHIFDANVKILRRGTWPFAPFVAIYIGTSGRGGEIAEGCRDVGGRVDGCCDGDLDEAG